MLFKPKRSLAILGESSVLANAQVSSLSRFFLLPRILPAPQALIRTARPERLDPSTGTVVGAHSGNIRSHVNHIAHLLLDGNALPAYHVRWVRITKTDRHPSAKARTLSPLTFLSVLGCAMSVALLVLSVVEEDGMALLATIMLSLVSSLVGVGSRCTLELKKRTASRPVPPSDVIIKYPHGAFLIVQCDEQIARELFWHPEACTYAVEPTVYRLLSLLATLLLMFGVIFLGNASLTLQISYAAAYLILNAAYWTVAALPQKWNWDLSCFDLVREHPADDEACGTFTSALWRAIAITRTVDWVKIAKIAPVNTAWAGWLDEAERYAIGNDPIVTNGAGQTVMPDWDCEAALSHHLKEN